MAARSDGKAKGFGKVTCKDCGDVIQKTGVRQIRCPECKVKNNSKRKSNTIRICPDHDEQMFYEDYPSGCPVCVSEQRAKKWDEKSEEEREVKRARDREYANAHKVEAKERMDTWNQEYPEKAKASTLHMRDRGRRMRQRTKEYLQSISPIGGKIPKCSVPNCEHDCPPECLDYHHVRFPKVREVTRMIKKCKFKRGGTGYTVKEVWEEVRKCVLMCPIHHRMLDIKYSHEELNERYEDGTFPEIYEGWNGRQGSYYEPKAEAA